MKIRLYTLPNFVTLCNLICGCIAIVYSLYFHSPVTAFIFIVAGAIFDFADGLVARLTKSYSDTGKQLDSLADLVSFGVAPAALLFHVANAGQYNTFTWMLWLLPLFSALRLAKFNVDERQTTYFRGLPTPAGALAVGSTAVAFGNLGIAAYSAIVIITGILMVSELPMFSLKFRNFQWKGNQARYFLIMIAALGVVFFRLYSVPFIIAAYVFISVAVHLFVPRRESLTSLKRCISTFFLRFAGSTYKRMIARNTFFVFIAGFMMLLGIMKLGAQSLGTYNPDPYTSALQSVGSNPFAIDDDPDELGPRKDSTERKPRKPLESYFFNDSIKERRIFVWTVDKYLNKIYMSEIDTSLYNSQIYYPFHLKGVGDQYQGNLGGASVLP